MVSAITTGSVVVNGFISAADVISLITGKDINGNELTDKERERLTQSVVIDAAFLSVSAYSKIKLKHINKGASGSKFSETFDNWDDMKNAHKGTVTQFVKDNKPLNASSRLVKNGGSLTIDTLDDGTQIWKYTKDGITVPYVPKMVNGKIENVVKFPNEYLYSKKNFDGSFKVPEGFTGNRTVDKTNALKYLEGKYGISEIPDGFILHHDIDNGVFQLVRNDVHSGFSHYGGHYYNK